MMMNAFNSETIIDELLLTSDRVDVCIMPPRDSSELKYRKMQECVHAGEERG